MTDVRVSVCMATYNGEAYLGEQLDSILAELAPHDELIIVDDASADGTVALLATVEDARVRVFPRDHNRGYVRTFEEALQYATGDVLMLADQDDVWIPGRRALFVAALQNDAVAASNLVLLGSDAPLVPPIPGISWRLNASQSGHSVRNELRILAGIIPYFGCAMAIRRDAVDRILPFPDFLTESHDLWIATFANAHRTMRHLDEPTLRRRLHEENVSTARPRGIVPVLRARWMLLRAWLAAKKR
ncbi:glycosyltransferase [Microbacterium sp. A93]|uniref:glycosyltransferase n=1 Tax=Microbacterium sp. A93 TaxID=3450716 RepID=UPI003F41C77E